MTRRILRFLADVPQPSRLTTAILVLVAGVFFLYLACHFVAPTVPRDTILRTNNHKEDVQAGVGRLDDDGFLPVVETGDTPCSR